MRYVFMVTLVVGFSIQQFGCNTSADNVPDHTNLGVVLDKKGDFLSARKELDEALRLLPETPENQERRSAITSLLRKLD